MPTMPNNYQCGHCGRHNRKDELVVIVKANNHCAYCPACEAWVINLPQHEPKLHFGKYKDSYIADIVKIDPQYLQWVMTQPWCKPNLRGKIEGVLRG